jgi:carbon monoxide dehydrogenase subunit G
MASIRKELRLNVPPEVVWDAVRDVGAVHKRLCPGVLTDARLENGARIVTFANGMTIRELIVDIDDDARRFVWAAVGDPLTHHNASMQVFEDGDRQSRLVWITDILPNSATGNIQALVDKGADAIRQTLESQTAGQKDARTLTHPGTG